MGETLSTCVSDGAENAQPLPVKQELEQVAHVVLENMKIYKHANMFLKNGDGS